MHKNEGTKGRVTRWGLYSHLEIKNNSVANRNRETASHYFFPILQSQQTQAYLQINVLLDAEFTTTRLKSVKIEDFYGDRK